MFRSGNVPFTATPVYAPEDVTGHYARINGLFRYFASEAEAKAYASEHARSFYEYGQTLRCGAEPVRHDLSPLYFRRALLDRRAL